MFRRLVLDDVRHDPLWFAGILARRTAATVMERKLWPTAARDGLWMARSDSPNEGLLDKYYTYTATVDFVGLGRSAWEMPVALLIGPTLLVVALSVHPSAAPSGRRRLALLGLLAAAGLALPVLVTTAGAQEPQAFAIVYLLGAAFLPRAIQDAVRAARARTGDAEAVRGS